MNFYRSVQLVAAASLGLTFLGCGKGLSAQASDAITPETRLGDDYELQISNDSPVMEFDHNGFLDQPVFSEKGSGRSRVRCGLGNFLNSGHFGQPGERFQYRLLHGDYSATANELEQGVESLPMTASQTGPNAQALYKFGARSCSIPYKDLAGKEFVGVSFIIREMRLKNESTGEVRKKEMCVACFRIGTNTQPLTLREINDALDRTLRFQAK